MPDNKPVIRFSFDVEIDLEVREVWPDGGAPKKITLEEVVKTFDGDKVGNIIRDWDLDTCFDEMHIMVVDVDPVGNRTTSYGTYRNDVGLSIVLR